MSRQIDEWSGSFGETYTDRNTHDLESLDDFYQQTYGITRRELNNSFIGNLSRELKILEVGCNVGNQIALLNDMGFKNVYGIDVNSYAIESSKKRLKNVSLQVGSAQNIPFDDGFFDMVFTSGVLIHVSPDDIKSVIKEICRCTKNYIWGFEYYSEKYTKVSYRGDDDLLWKTTFSKLYQTICPELLLIKDRKIKYLENENVDMMFLLEKGK